MNELVALNDEVKKLSIIITGNGHPEQGMYVKLDRVMQSHDNLSKDIKEIKGRLWILVLALIVNFLGFAGNQLWQMNQKVNKLTNLDSSPISAFGNQVPTANAGIASTSAYIH